MDDSVRAFYDDFAGDYHLLFADWPASISYQAETLDRLIRAELGAGPRSLLDCACGIGTQAIGLALRGHRVRATDLSPVAVERLREEAAARGADVDASVADLGALRRQVSGAFDVVLACDNVLPHLLTDNDLHRAVANMAAMLTPGGLFLVSVRDYDLLKKTRPRTAEPRAFDDPDGRRIAFQVWDWHDDGDRYRVHQFIIRQTGDAWNTRHAAPDYRTLGRAELATSVQSTGLLDLRWHEPATSGYYQPIMTARKER